jgi:release factor glutamine methyltransferase
LPWRDRLRRLSALPSNATRAHAVAATRLDLNEAGVDNPALDARLLTCGAASLKAADLLRDPDFELGAENLARLRAFAARRAIAGEPVSRILGRREFWGLPLAISKDVLDPRADTEILVEAAVTALSARRGEALRVLDLGAGSGAILCALLTEWPNARGVALDLSAAASRLASENLAGCGLASRAKVIVGSWGDALDAQFDVIVSNPPYIASSEIASLSREVRDHDPRLALDGGEDGLDAYRAIAPLLQGSLDRDGRFFLEVGADQAERVVAAIGWPRSEIATHRDLAGHVRVVSGRQIAADARH